MAKRKNKLISNLWKFITIDLWELELTEINKIKKFLLYIIKGAYLVIIGFVKDQCLLRSSALTYTTTLSIVPLLAVGFAVSKGFGFQNTDLIKGFLYKISAGKSEVVNKIIEYINNTNVTALGAIGVATLLLTVISLLGNIEKSFNTIWGVKKARSFGKKFTDYLSITLIYPFLTVIAVSATASLQSNKIVQKILSLSVLSSLYLFLLKMTPYITVWIALTFIYFFMPNTKVKITSALIGGIIGGTLWQLAQVIYIQFQIGVAKYNAIYGSFSQIPLFLIWLYISWIIVLLGAEISFAAQNLKTYHKESGSLNISIKDKDKFALRIMLLLSKNFYANDKMLTNENISEQLNIPVKLVNEILSILDKTSLVIEVKKDDIVYYIPGKPLEKISIYDIINRLHNYGEMKLRVSKDNEYSFINKINEKIDENQKKFLKKFTLTNIIKGYIKI